MAVVVFDFCHFKRHAAQPIGPRSLVERVVVPGHRPVFSHGLGLNPTLSPEVQAFGLAVITYLLYAFVITLAVDLLFVLPILLIEVVFAWVLGRQVQYNNR